jgi:L-alanine-DL-glutamate epimerase-like enolase superfamily enzyme
MPFSFPPTERFAYHSHLLSICRRPTMKIERIETMVLRIPYSSGGPSDTEAWGGKAWKTADVLLVKISTDAGVTGWGEAFGYNVIPATQVAIDQILSPMCVGRDALAIESLMQ